MLTGRLKLFLFLSFIFLSNCKIIEATESKFTEAMESRNEQALTCLTCKSKVDKPQNCSECGKGPYCSPKCFKESWLTHKQNFHPLLSLRLKEFGFTKPHPDPRTGWLTPDALRGEQGNFQTTLGKIFDYAGAIVLGRAPKRDTDSEITLIHRELDIEIPKLDFTSFEKSDIEQAVDDTTLNAILLPGSLKLLAVVTPPVLSMYGGRSRPDMLLEGTDCWDFAWSYLVSRKKIDPKIKIQEDDLMGWFSQNLEPVVDTLKIDDVLLWGEFDLKERSIRYNHIAIVKDPDLTSIQHIKILNRRGKTALITEESLSTVSSSYGKSIFFTRLKKLKR